jgi:hypothetical protein
MITIRAGELFVEKYNEENGTKLSPKEIFRMLADKAFRGGRHMVNWTNSKFFNYLKEYNKFLDGKREEPSFEEAVEKFCNYVEDRSCGIETSLNVYGGCALPKGADGKMNVTEFNYCDNLHFSIDERYCSFIGAFFIITLDTACKCAKSKYFTIINNKSILWLLYSGFDKYYKFIHNNDGLDDKDLGEWNGCYLYETIMNHDEFTYNNKLKNNGIVPLDFLEFLEVICRADGLRVEVLELECLGQYNSSCGCVTLDLENVKGWFNIFNKIVANSDEEFDIDAYCKLFNKDNLLRVSMEYGEVTSDMIDPLFDLKTRMKNNEFNGKNRIKFLNEYLKVIMSKKENNMAKEFGQFLTKSTKNKKSISFKAELENIFSAKKVTDLGNAIVAMCNKANVPYNEGTTPYNVITHFTDDEKNREKLMEFLMYTKFNM